MEKNNFIIIQPDDWHIHLREGPIAKLVIKDTYNTFGRAGTILGPAMVAVFLNLFNNLQIALIPIIILFIIGGILMYFVNEAYEDSV